MFLLRVHKVSCSRFHAVNSKKIFTACAFNSNYYHHPASKNTTFRTNASSTTRINEYKSGEMDSSESRRKIRGVIFDMDGTLTVPNLDFNEMMRRLGCKTNNILKEVDGFDETRRKRSYEIIAEMEEEALKTMKAMPGAVKLAKFLDEMNIPRGLVTRNVKTSVDHFHNVAWKDGDSDSLMKAYYPVCSREFTPYKPAPDSLLHICKEWGVDPSEVMMVGDSPKDDVVAGNRAGCVTVLVDVEDTNRSYDIDKLEGEHIPHFIVPRIEDVSQLLNFHFEVIGNGVGETKR
jgi:HAD superfamily hydrolase (TIGR01549 family)